MHSERGNAGKDSGCRHTLVWEMDMADLARGETALR